MNRAIALFPTLFFGCFNASEVAQPEPSSGSAMDGTGTGGTGVHGGSVDGSHSDSETVPLDEDSDGLASTSSAESPGTSSDSETAGSSASTQTYEDDSTSGDSMDTNDSTSMTDGDPSTTGEPTDACDGKSPGDSCGVCRACDTSGNCVAEEADGDPCFGASVTCSDYVWGYYEHNDVNQRAACYPYKNTVLEPKCAAGICDEPTPADCETVSRGNPPIDGLCSISCVTDTSGCVKGQLVSETDVSGMCVRDAETTDCSSTCSAETVAEVRQCDSDGICSPTMTTDCLPLFCEEGACKTECTDDSDCFGPATCGPGGSCVPCSAETPHYVVRGPADAGGMPNGGGGLAGADADCQEAADLNGAGDLTWKAVLSSSTVDARDRICIAGDVYLWDDGNGDPKDTLVATKNAWWSTEHEAPTDRNWVGTFINEAVWLATTSTGVYSENGDCLEWESSAGAALGGVGNTFPWVSFSDVSCGTAQRLLCISQ